MLITNHIINYDLIRNNDISYIIRINKANLIISCWATTLLFLLGQHQHCKQQQRQRQQQQQQCQCRQRYAARQKEKEEEVFLSINQSIYLSIYLDPLNLPPLPISPQPA